MENTSDTTELRPRIYVASLADYNAGNLLGRWMYADNGLEEIRRQIAEMLAESREEIAEEWAIHDYEGFGSLRLSEYEDLERVAELGELISQHGKLFAELAAMFGGTGGIEEASTHLDERYRGEFGSLAEFAEELVDECYGGEIAKLPDFIRYHIDYESIARDMELSGELFTVVIDYRVHVFHHI